MLLFPIKLQEHFNRVFDQLFERRQPLCSNGAIHYPMVAAEGNRNEIADSELWFSCCRLLALLGFHRYDSLFAGPNSQNARLIKTQNYYCKNVSNFSPLWPSSWRTIAAMMRMKISSYLGRQNNRRKMFDSKHSQIGNGKCSDL